MIFVSCLCHVIGSIYCLHILVIFILWRLYWWSMQPIMHSKYTDVHFSEICLRKLLFLVSLLSRLSWWIKLSIIICKTKYLSKQVDTSSRVTHREKITKVYMQLVFFNRLVKFGSFSRQDSLVCYILDRGIGWLLIQ